MTQLAVILAYLALLLGLGFVAKRLFRGTSADYLLASHTIGPDGSVPVCRRSIRRGARAISEP